jgi:capsular exopolysaccharide synthesis family protein
MPRRPVAEAPTGDALDGHLATLLAPASLAAEHYRVLAHAVEQRRRSDGVVAVGVTSPGPEDGKTLTAINVAGALANQSGTRVLLVELDLRAPALAGRLALGEDVPTLTDALGGEGRGLDAAVIRLAAFNLDVLVAGRAVPAPYDVLRSARLAELLSTARTRYDHVVVDTPPAIPFPDSRVIARLVDGFLVVVGAHRTPRRLLEDALGALPADKVLGLVFNGDDEAASYGVRYGFASARRATPAPGRPRLSRTGALEESA